MKQIYNEITIKWNRWEDPGNYPNNIATKPLPPGPWIPESTEGHALYQMTEQDWDDARDLDTSEEVAEFFKLDTIENLQITEAAFLPVEDYAVIVPTKIGAHICESDLPREILKVKMQLDKIKQDEMDAHERH